MAGIADARMTVIDAKRVHTNHDFALLVNTNQFGEFPPFLALPTKAH